MNKAAVIGVILLLTGWGLGYLFARFSEAFDQAHNIQSTQSNSLSLDVNDSVYRVESVQSDSADGLNLRQAKVLITQLKQRLQQLEQQGLQQQQQLKLLQRQLADTTTQLERQSTPSATQSSDLLSVVNGQGQKPQPQVELFAAQRIEPFLPKPFDGFYHLSNPSFVARMNQFIIEPSSFEFAQMMALKIGDFIELHQLGYQVELQSVVCKSTSCLLRLFELEADSWQRILNDLQLQDWWQFNHSSLSVEGREGKALVVQVVGTHSL